MTGDDVGSSTIVRSASSMSQIPVPLSRNKSSVASTSSAMPKRVPVSLPRNAPSSTSSRSNNQQRGKGRSTSSLTVPRAPMTSVINQAGPIVEDIIADAPLRKVINTANGVPKSTNRRRVSGGQRGSGRGPLQKNVPDEGRMNAIESRITSMQDLFDTERRRTEDLLFREQHERQVQEDRVRQLEEDLLEQRRTAEKNSSGASAWLGEEEVRQMKQKYEMERVQLQQQLEHEQMAVNALKVSSLLSAECMNLAHKGCTVFTLLSIDISTHSRSVQHCS
jgi:kinesin family protein C1